MQRLLNMDLLYKFLSNHLRQNGLSIALALDGIIGILFGLASLLFPKETFGTIVNLGESHNETLLLSALASLSIFYLCQGAVCLVGAMMPPPSKHWLAILQMASHFVWSIKGLCEAGSTWIIGNPWPDIVIHALFVGIYLATCRPATWRRPRR